MVAGVVNEMRGIDGVKAELTLADLLPNAAVTHPDRIAVVGAARQFSYREADEAARAVAESFLADGIASGQHVVLSMHKTADSYIIIHALLRIGAVVVPIDPLMPSSSASALITSVGPAAIVVDAASMQRLDVFAGSFPAGVFSTDSDDPQATSLRALIDQPTGPLTDAASDSTVAPEHPAYVIFTSGSTGVPKGITHTHRSAMAYARLAVDVHGITADDRLAGLPPLHFDMSTLELYSAPLAGAAIVPVGTAELRFPADFTELAERERITIWYSVPFQLRQISERGALDQRDLSSLRHVIYAGEPFSAPALAALMDQLPGVRFSNAYGPAETNVVTVHELLSAPVGAVPIGRPWGDVKVAVVDPATCGPGSVDLVDVANGVLGELWVKADSTMIGYLNRPDLTAERLIGSAEERWYRTGDLVRRDDDGVLWLAGRIDHQVKVRGTRLELEAIEAVLAASPQVAEAVVAPDVAGSSIDHVVAAVTLAPGVDELDQRSLRRWCLSNLAQVAVPLDVFVWASFPLTSSGKIDRAQVRSAPNNPPSSTIPHDPATNGNAHV